MKKLITILLLLIPLGMFAQEKEKKVFNKEFKPGDYTPICVSYYGNLATHPGIKLGFDWNLFLIEKTKDKRKRVKTVRKMLIVTPSLTYYRHKATYKGLIIAADIAWRRYSKRLYFREMSFGMGYFRKFNTGETWGLGDDGTPISYGHTSRGYFTPSISLACGKQYLIKQAVPVAIFARVNGNIISGYDAAVVADLSLELGLRMTLDWGIKVGETKTFTKSR